jgi:PKHD-type hydroxylase
MKPNCWAWIDDGLSSELCDLLLKEFNNIEPIAGSIGGDSKGTVDTKKRNSQVRWLKRNHWIEGILFNHGKYANKSADWNYQLDFAQPIQLTQYDINGHYGWHEDWAPLSESEFVRKVSIVCLLNDPSEFEGGEFQFKNETVPLKKGSIVAFPSFLEHQVTPVIKGIRYSAVCWIEGKMTL